MAIEVSKIMSVFVFYVIFFYSRRKCKNCHDEVTTTGGVWKERKQRMLVDDRADSAPQVANETDNERQ